jgi:uncharacterized membrane protein
MYSIPSIFAKLNRIRGHRYKPKYLPNKLAVYVAMTLIAAILCTPAIYLGSYFKPAGDLLGWVIMFQIGWGKYFMGGKNTAEEKEFWLADKYADFKMDDEYTTRSPYWFERQWKTHAMNFRLCFGLVCWAILHAITTWDIVTLAVVLWKYRGLGEIYEREFSADEVGAVERSELLVGKEIGKLVLVSCLLANAIAVGRYYIGV